MTDKGRGTSLINPCLAVLLTCVLNLEGKTNMPESITKRCFFNTSVFGKPTNFFYRMRLFHILAEEKCIHLLYLLHPKKYFIYSSISKKDKIYKKILDVSKKTKMEQNASNKSQQKI